jgi:hypothetical protein
VYCFKLAYFSKGKVKNKKNWETKLILGVAMAKKFFNKEKKSPDLPYLVLLSTYVARNM